MSNRISGLIEIAPNNPWPTDLPVRRVDLHCHSNASNEADEAVLNAIECPESFSTPQEVYEQAHRRGMDFFTVTDHDVIDGVRQLLVKPGVLIGEELTCYFPEDRCKIHLLVWGLNDEDHTALQAVADDIYKVARIIQDLQLAHSVAHPVYRQNDRLERWHMERLVLMFKGFETLNGAHSVLHRRSLEPLLDSLTPAIMEELSIRHGMPARWPMAHLKARTGGSDDHGLFNIGRTWTEFPGDVKEVDDILDCLRTGRCRPGGEAGSSLKLAHNFYGVGIRYYGRKMQRGSAGKTLHGLMLGKLIGERGTARRRDWVRAAVVSKAESFSRKLIKPFKTKKEPTGAALLLDLFLGSAGKQLPNNAALMTAMKSGYAVLGEHNAMFDFISSINRDIAGGIADSVKKSMARRELTGVFDAVSSVVAHQFLLLPYYFALFHQNRERHLLPRITGYGGNVTSETMKIGVFTDTFDEINGVGRFIQDMSRQAQLRDRTLVVHTSTENPRMECPSRKNFKPLLSCPLPYYPDQPMTLPPLAEILEWADRQQFDAIHVHTPGAMGLCGLLVAMMLKVPVLGTYHTDFPQYIQNLTGDHRLTTGTTGYLKWFYGQTRTTFSRSREYRAKLRDLGFAEDKLMMTLPGVDTDKFSPEKRDMEMWHRLGVTEPYKLLYAGRVSLEKNLPFMAETFKKLCAIRNDVALVIAGDGPYMAGMKESLAGLPVYFLGYQNDDTLPGLYASSDLFVFPSKTDTLGQVVIESQAAGLPVLVSNHGGPKEVMDDQITGLVLPTESSNVWVDAIHMLLNDTPKRMRMSRTAPHRVARFSLRNTFEAFWDEHLKAATQAGDEARGEAVVRNEKPAAVAV